MRLHPRFLPKVVSEFHISKVVHLLEFFPKPHGGRAEQRLHMLDIVLPGQDKTFQAMSQIVSTERTKGQAVSAQRISLCGLPSKPAYFRHLQDSNLVVSTCI